MTNPIDTKPSKENWVEINKGELVKPASQRPVASASGPSPEKPDGEPKKTDSSSKTESEKKS